MRIGALLSAVLAATSPGAAEEAAPPEQAVWTLPFVPVALRYGDDRRLRWIELVFVPTGHRRICQGKKVKECREVAAGRFLERHARRSNEPAEILTVRVDEASDKDGALLRALVRAPGVRRLSERKDSGWAPAGEGMEYPIDRKRIVRAEVRWLRRPEGERLELIRLR